MIAGEAHLSRRASLDRPRDAGPSFAAHPLPLAQRANNGDAVRSVGRADRSVERRPCVRASGGSLPARLNAVARGTRLRAGALRRRRRIAAADGIATRGVMLSAGRPGFRRTRRIDHVTIAAPTPRPSADGRPERPARRRHRSPRRTTPDECSTASAPTISAATRHHTPEGALIAAAITPPSKPAAASRGSDAAS